MYIRIIDNYLEMKTGKNDKITIYRPPLCIALNVPD